jgi:hypothetical protein
MGDMFSSFASQKNRSMVPSSRTGRLLILMQLSANVNIDIKKIKIDIKLTKFCCAEHSGQGVHGDICPIFEKLDYDGTFSFSCPH